ncbi:hypothetical protein FT663_01756 [Candidozyma haemuli var. vulneris]|uniref:Transcription factor domain-containing protein n=1 Tax=Candidozyma haemuli TaxID=45357 RepID=A0A2V1AR44_9ASCO|nr:hypothetical protein CXQ85_002334 [[Candida] haemuloni]KAF3989512.1 hypothetical protein FT662_02781 [[Candida] haemuloni var. vulneris]KAF3993767.1 hypothetical protein FT663_01756 [[Candida] haemuloni var. vulneris]PVH20540.1 hypothetical protein CXQ85_002334 [[Candida] haemuloni]
MSHFNSSAHTPHHAHHPSSDQPFPYHHGAPQQIPSIVVNPINSDKRHGEYSNSSHILPQPSPTAQDPRLGAQMIYNVHQRPPQPYPGNFYPPMQSQPLYYPGQPQQHHVAGQDDGRYGRAPLMSRIHGNAQLQPLISSSSGFARPTASPVELSPPMGAKELRTTFKPRRVKKNSKPKINKISHEALEMQFARKKQEKTLSEHTLDSLYDDFQEALKIPSPRASLASAYENTLESELEVKLFDLFVHVISKSIDSFLPHECFQKLVAELALYEDTKMILNAIFCLSSLILSRINPDAIDPSYPLKYYQKTVGTIRHHLSRPDAEDERNGILARCLLSTILLCIYELFFVAIDSTYVKGAASIFISIMSRRNRSESLIGNSPFYHTCFWAMFVCDLILSLKLELPNMYSLEKTWKAMDPIYFESFNDASSHSDEPAKSVKDVEAFLSSSLLTGQSTFWWQYKVIITLSSINEFSNSYDVISQEDFTNNKEFHQWMELNQRLDDIDRNLPVSLKPSVCRPASRTRVFPHILFKDEATAIVGLNYKLAKISHYVKLASKLRIMDDFLIEEQLAKYPSQYRVKLAKDLVGILQSYCNSSIWPVTIHALRAASRNIDKNDEVVMEELKRFTRQMVQFSHTHSDFVPPSA